MNPNTAICALGVQEFNFLKNINRQTRFCIFVKISQLVYSFITYQIISCKYFLKKSFSSKKFSEVFKNSSVSDEIESQSENS